MKSPTRSLEELRFAIVDTALSRTPLYNGRTVLADVVAHKTVDFIAEAMRTRGASVDEWMRTTLDNRVSTQDLFHVLPDTVAAAVETLRLHAQLDAEDAETLRALEETLKVHLVTYRGGSRAQRLHAIDIVDAKIDQLLHAMASHDELTAEHSRAVSMWCMRIAKRMSLPQRDVVTATRGGLVHDLGKLKTPTEILSAPRALDETEWEIMKRHAVEGEAVVSEIPELRALAPIVRWHHERFDGSGYPDAREAAELPIATRIATVADAFNAMIARRPYRAPLTPAVAVEQLRKAIGSHFDPAVVAAMIDVVRGADGEEGLSA